jgi:hypothetical protein
MRVSGYLWQGRAESCSNAGFFIYLPVSILKLLMMELSTVNYRHIHLTGVFLMIHQQFPGPDFSIWEMPYMERRVTYDAELKFLLYINDQCIGEVNTHIEFSDDYLDKPHLLGQLIITQMNYNAKITKPLNTAVQWNEGSHVNDSFSLDPNCVEFFEWLSDITKQKQFFAALPWPDQH